MHSEKSVVTYANDRSFLFQWLKYLGKHELFAAVAAAAAANSIRNPIHLFLFDVC